MLKVVFMGSDAIALPSLNWLAGSGLAQIIAVYTQPDRAVGRGQKIQPNAIKIWAEAKGVPVFQPEKIGASELVAFAGLSPDLSLVMAYGHILKQEFIDVPRLGTFNLHTSLLPKYRGASPIQTATAEGVATTGVTLMKMVRQLDAGPIAGTESVGIGALDTAAEVEARLAQACVPLLQRCLPAILAGNQEFTPQRETAATFCRRLEKVDGVVDFTAPSAVIAARINGLNPWPGCSVVIHGQLVKLGLADATTGVAAQPGTVLGADADGLLVATGQGTLRLRKLQRPGGKMLPAAEFLRGMPIATGTILPSNPMPALSAPQPFPYRKG